MNRPKRSSSDTSDPGAAQFVNNLSPEQLQHLRYAVPRSEEPDRFSQFLEHPRTTPVPNRFTVDLVALAARNNTDGCGKSSRDGSKHSRKPSSRSLKSSKASTKHTRQESAKSVKSTKSMKSIGEASESSKLESAKSMKSIKSMASMQSALSSGATQSVSSTISKPDSVDMLKQVERVVSVDWRFYGTGVCLCILNLVAAWDVTTLPIALSTIAQAFDGSTLECLWLSLAFLTAATVFLPLFATFSDIFGRRSMLIVALSFYSVGAFVSAMTGNFTGMHLGRLVQGIGAGGIYALSKLIVSDLVSAIDRWKWSAILGIMWALGAITGTVIGGAFSQIGQWRWIFWINLPFCLVVLLFLAFFAQLKPATPDPVLPRLRNVDWLGYVLFAGSLVSVLLGLVWAGTLYAWSSFPTTLPISFGIIGIIVCLFWSFFSPFPSIINMKIFMTLSNVATYFGAFVQGMIAFALLYFIPLYLSIMYSQHSLMRTGVCLLAWLAPLVFFALVGFVVMSKTRYLIPQIWCAWCIVVIGVALMALFKRTTPTATWAGVAAISGSGLGILYPSLSLASILSVRAVENDEENNDLQHAVINLAFFQTLGQTVGVACAGVIFQNELFKNYRKTQYLEFTALHSAKNALNLIDDVRNISSVNASFKANVMGVYVDSLRPIWFLLAGLAGAALLTSFLINNGIPRHERARELKTLSRSYVV